eukprot:8668438-Lingulodinium_polyedra.AAC.1
MLVRRPLRRAIFDTAKQLACLALEAAFVAWRHGVLSATVPPWRAALLPRRALALRVLAASASQ